MIKSFKIGAKEFTVALTQDALGEYTGICKSDELLIKISEGYPDKVQEQALWHEIVHCILFELGETELDENERFVQSFSLLLHQVLESIVLSE